jgi:ADP-ribose pyrophosphatase YjhB (NUDIX family)
MENNSSGPQVALLKRAANNSYSVLLIKRSDLKVWALPGGRKNPGEEMESAAIREIKEETGYNIKLLWTVGTYSLPHARIVGKATLFVGQVTDGEVMPNKEVTEIRWFSVERLPYTLLPFHRQRIRDAVAGKRNINATQAMTIRRILLHYLVTPWLLFPLFRFRYHVLKNAD